MTTINTEDYLTSSQVAERLNLTTDTVKIYCQRGVIQAVKFGQTWMIHKEEVDRYQEQRKGPGRPTAEN